MKGLWIYRLDSKPKRLNNYNNYFTRYLETKDEKYFLEFLHFYEPKLNRIAKNFIAKYGLDRERLDDLKQIFPLSCGKGCRTMILNYLCCS